MSTESEFTENARIRSQTETRQRLRSAAAHLFAQKGCQQTRTVDIAKEAGVAVGTIYLHFKDKNALLRDILRMALSHLKLVISEAPAPSETTGESIVQARMEALVAFVETYPDLAAVLFDASNLGTEPGRETLDFLTVSQENGLQAGINDGYYRSDLNNGLTARALVGVLVHVLGWWSQNMSSVDRKEVVKVLVETRMNGIKKA